MAKQVRDTNAGKSIGAWIILNKKGEHVATVNSHYSNGGRVTVDVWNIGDAVQACLTSALKCGALSQAKLDKACEEAKGIRDWIKPEEAQRWAAYDLFGNQQGGAGGYGYDKFTAAISRLWIDGQQIANHCGSVANAEKAKQALFRQYCKFHDFSGERARVAEKGWDRKHWDKRAAAIGAHFANWCSEKNRYTSLHFRAGLERLEALGYRVIQAI